MGKVIDISAKLTNEKPKLRLSEDKVYEINDDKNTILLLNQKMENAELNEIEAVDEMLKMLLGKDAAQELNEMNMSLSNYNVILIAVMAAVTGEEYETVESRFRRKAGLD